MAYATPKTYILLASTPASSSASIPFTSLITANFSTYFVSITDCVMQTINTTLLLTFSTDNGSNYLNSNYQWENRTQNPNSSGTNSSDSDTSISLQLAARNAAPGTDANFYLFNMNSSTYHPSCLGEYATGNNGGSVTVYAKISGLNTTTTPVTAIQFASSSGNITSGTFNFYGVTEP